MLKALLGFAVALSLAYCSSTKPKRHDPIWIGKTEKELIKKFGLPNENRADQNGGKVFVYKTVEEHTVHGTKEKQKITVERSFYLDSSGKIYQTE